MPHHAVILSSFSPPVFLLAPRSSLHAPRSSLFPPSSSLRDIPFLRLRNSLSFLSDRHFSLKPNRPALSPTNSLVFLWSFVKKKKKQPLTCFPMLALSRASSFFVLDSSSGKARRAALKVSKPTYDRLRSFISTKRRRLRRHGVTVNRTGGIPVS